jgi:hypothetical protein
VIIAVTCVVVVGTGLAVRGVHTAPRTGTPPVVTTSKPGQSALPPCGWDTSIVHSAAYMQAAAEKYSSDSVFAGDASRYEPRAHAVFETLAPIVKSDRQALAPGAEVDVPAPDTCVDNGQTIDWIGQRVVVAAASGSTLTLVVSPTNAQTGTFVVVVTPSRDGAVWVLESAAA